MKGVCMSEQKSEQKKGEQEVPAVYDARQLGVPKMGILGLQHMFAMFGSTILVPVLTGLSISATLLFAGLGTLLFHLISKRKVPAFLGSSFAFFARLLCHCRSWYPVFALCVLGRCVRGAYVFGAFRVVLYFWRGTRYALFPAGSNGPHCYLYWPFAGKYRHCKLRN